MKDPKPIKEEQNELEFPQDFDQMKCDTNILLSTDISESTFTSSGDHLPVIQTINEANELVSHGELYNQALIPVLYCIPN